MPLHPQCKAFLDELAAMGGPPMHELTPAEMRARSLPPDLMGPEQAVHAVSDRTIPGPGGPIPIRIYEPGAGDRRPALLFFHGGGFVIGGLDQVDRQCRQLAFLSGYVVVSVDYRLAPEHRFPAAVDDASAATAYVARSAHELGIDPGRIAVGGESAGGTLAGVVALLARDRGGPPLIFQLLIYPSADVDDDSPSMREFDGHFLTRAVIDHFNGLYLPPQQDRRDFRVSPLHAPTLASLPPAFVITAECDPVRDQGEAYARRLEASGVPVSLKRYEGMIHPFFSLAGIVDGGRLAINDAAQALAAAARQPQRDGQPA